MKKRGGAPLKAGELDLSNLNTSRAEEEELEFVEVVNEEEKGEAEISIGQNESESGRIDC
jgi:hypothetical protein